MFKEIKDEWISVLNENPDDLVRPVNHKGWHTNSAIVSLLEILEKAFEVVFDFAPEKKIGPRRNTDFNLIQELSDLDRLDIYVPSFTWQVKDAKQSEKDIKKKGVKMIDMSAGDRFPLSMAMTEMISNGRLAICIESDIEETEGTWEAVFHDSSEKEQRPTKIPKRPIKKEIPNDLPF